VIQRYCYDTQNPLPERLRDSRSHGRFMTLFFHSHSARLPNQKHKGFLVTYNFQGAEEGTFMNFKKKIMKNMIVF
jgi:hypothetical protein